MTLRQPDHGFRRADDPTSGRVNGTRPVIDLRIDELLLHGFSPRDRYTISDALRQELGRLLSESGLAGGFRDKREVERVDAGTLSLGADVPADEIGRQLAHAIHGVLHVGHDQSTSCPSIHEDDRVAEAWNYGHGKEVTHGYEAQEEAIRLFGKPAGPRYGE